MAIYQRNNKLGVSFKMDSDESKLSFLRTSLRFYSALAILEPQIYVVVEHFGVENISLLRERRVKTVFIILQVMNLNSMTIPF